MQVCFRQTGGIGGLTTGCEIGVEAAPNRRHAARLAAGRRIATRAARRSQRIGALVVALVIAVGVAPIAAQEPASERLAVPARRLESLDLRALPRSVATRGAVLPDDRVRVTLEDTAGGADGLQLVRLRGDTSESRVARIASNRDGTATLDLERGTAYVLRAAVESRASETLTREGIVLPGRVLYCPTEAEDPGAQPVVRTFGLYLALREEPIPWQAAERFHHTTLIAGIAEVGTPVPGPAVPSMPAFDPPLTVRFTANGASTDDEVLVIAQAGVAGYQTTGVTVKRQVAVAPRVTALSDLGRVDLGFVLAPVTASLELIATKSVLLGYGLERTEVTVFRTLPTSHDAERAMTVSFESTAGQIPASVTIPAGEDRAIVGFRSDALGPVEITARGPEGLVSNTITIACEWRVGFLIATVLGALAGGFAAWLQERYLRTKKHRQPALCLPRVLGGLVAGVFLELVVVFGIYKPELLDIAHTEAGAFLVGLLGGWIGLAIIDLVRKLLGLVPPVDEQEPARTDP